MTLSDGKSVKLDASAFSLYRGVPNRDDRKKVMDAFFNALGALQGHVRIDAERAGAGRTSSTPTRATTRRRSTPRSTGRTFPTSVYKSLVDGVNQGLPTFHRYLQLRKKMMGLPDLHYYDLYAPLVASADLTYTPEESEKHVLASLAPLGPEYVAAVRRAFNERWIDLLPNDGKRSGAYSNGAAYDVHPYMLINFNGKYSDMSTVAHELGHTMQSYLSNKTQPFHLANYPIFVAEVASTFNEALLIDYMLKTIKDNDTRLSLLGNYLENIKGTVFRQTQFAEFELRMHEMAEKGAPITGEALDKLYLEITRKYYGHDKNVCGVAGLHRARMGVHPALLLELLRLPVRDVVHRVGGARRQGARRRCRRDEAVPRVPVGGRLEVSDRSAQGRRRRHDDRANRCSSRCRR